MRTLGRAGVFVTSWSVVWLASLGSMMSMVSMVWVVPAARAGSLKGQVLFPPPVRDERPSPPPLAFWRLDNGIVPPLPATEIRSDVMVILDPVRRPAEPPPVMLEARPLHIEPRIVVGQAGTTITIKNVDQVPHTLFLEKGDNLMPRQPTAPGAARALKLTEAGEYHIADADYPHGGCTVLIAGTPWSARVDDKGSFSFDAPDGSYILRAFFRGAWNEGQAVEVGRSKDVVIKLEERSKPGAARAEKK